jgi:PKD repeat protein
MSTRNSVRMDPVHVRPGMRLSWAFAVAIAWSLVLVPAAVAAAPGQVGYARLTHACPPPQAGSATCFAIVRRPVAAEAADSPGVHSYLLGAGAASSGPAGGLTPGQLASAYAYDPTGGSGQTVAIVDAYDDPKIEEDLAVFDSHYGLGECTKADGCFRKVNQDGSESPADLPSVDETGWSQEIALDVEMVRAVCRGCRILLVEANGSDDEDLAKAVDEAVALGATEVSNSYGGPEAGIGSEQQMAYDHPGVVITAAGGDYGYDDWNYWLLGYEPPGMPNAPASLPSVVSVGGTSLKLKANGTRASETVWNDDGVNDEKEFGAGYVTTSGCSTIFTAPLWQQDASGFSAAGCGDKRLSVDVSADGDPYTGFDIYDNFNYCQAGTECHEEVQEEIERYGGWETLGGTSVGTPLIASLYALAGGAEGMKYPALALYGHLGDAASLYDVTVGGDGLCDGEPASVCGRPNTERGNVYDCEETSACDARTGYDGPSGVGTPNGLEAFKPLLPTAVITPPASVRAAVPASFSASRSSDPYPGGSVTSYSWSWGDGSSNSSGIAPTHTYSTAGEYTLTLTVTDDYGLVSLPVSAPVTVLARTVKEIEEETLAKKKAEEEALAKKRGEEEMAARKAEEEALAKKAEEEAAVAKKAEEELVAGEKAEEEREATRKISEELALLELHAEEATTARLHEAEAAAEKTAEELAAAGKKLEAEVAAAAVERRHEEEAKVEVLSIREASPDANIASAPLRASSSGAVIVRIGCASADTRCTGTVTLRTLKALVGAGRSKPTILTLGSGGFTVAGGKVVTVVLHLSGRLRALLERSHELRVRVTIAAHDPAGATHTDQALTTLFAPSATRGKR